MTIVDAHVHVWEMPSARYPWNPILDFVPKAGAPVEMLLEHMAQNGVSKAVLVQPSSYGYDHSYLGDSLRKYPDKLVGVGLVDPRKEGAPERLEFCVRRLGLRGLRLFPMADPQTTWLNDESTFPLWEKAAELKVPICLFILPHQLGRLEDMARNFPQVAIVIDHLGRPVAEESPYSSLQGLLRLADYPNVYVKLSGIPVASRQDYPYRDTHPLIKMVHEAFGARRMMWATDFPHILRQCGYEKALRLTSHELPFLSDEDKEWVLGKTALSLWEFGGA